MKKLFILAFTLMATISSTAQLITIQTDAAEGALPIVTAHTASPIVYDAENDHTVVRLAATAVAKDIESIIMNMLIWRNMVITIIMENTMKKAFMICVRKTIVAVKAAAFFVLP